MIVWLTQCGLAAEGAMLLVTWGTPPALPSYNLTCECQQWTLGTVAPYVGQPIRCAQSLTLWPLHELYDCGDAVGFTVMGEPLPNRITPQTADLFIVRAWAVQDRPTVLGGRFRYTDVNFDGRVNPEDLAHLTALVVAFDRRGDWNYDGFTNSIDLADYLAAGGCCR